MLTCSAVASQEGTQYAYFATMQCAQRCKTVFHKGPNLFRPFQKKTAGSVQGAARAIEKAQIVLGPSKIVAR